MSHWDTKFMGMALEMAEWSKDPSKKVGCYIVNDDHIQISGGFNGFPRGIVDNDRLYNKEIKREIIVHAEVNAIDAAARIGHALFGGTAYVTHPVCARCASSLIQAGIKKVIYLGSDKPSSWKASCDLALCLFSEAGIPCLDYRTIPENK